MFIVINCLGLPFNGNTIKNGSLGGSESAAYYLAKDLAVKGHKVTVFTNSQEEGVFDNVSYIFAGNQTEHAPLGETFHFYASNTPHDVLIIQRHPQAFKFQYASKINLWWVHDLAIIRQKSLVSTQLWNISGILTVSQYHKDQIVDVYGINPGIIFPIQNGIDLSLFDGDLPRKIDKADATDVIFTGELTKLLYTSRPERGLEHLVMPDGIMEKLDKLDLNYHLYICSYENNTEEMKPYYDYLYGRAEQLRNVTVLGHLTKQELADVMRQCNALVYPTPSLQAKEFNEVSCITAMEAMAAGLPFISSKRGALPETCKDSGSILLDVGVDGMPVIDDFVSAIVDLEKDNKDGEISKWQLKAAKKYDWTYAGNMTLNIIDKLFNRNRSNGGVLRSLIRNSDYYAALKVVDNKVVGNIPRDDSIVEWSINELDSQYTFAKNNTWSEHYQRYYEYEKARGVNYGAESLDGNDRFEYVSHIISGIKSGGTVLDYGCAHGHYTINLAKRFPEINFVGVDIAKTNIEKAKAWAEEDDVNNVLFVNSFIMDDGYLDGSESSVVLNKYYGMSSRFDAIISAEVVEHVKSAQHIIDSLSKLLSDDGLMIVTTPFGAWEAQGYKEHWNWRAHVHHFEREDLHDMFSHHPNFRVIVAACGYSKWGQSLGSYITTFNKPNLPSKNIDFERKLKQVTPIQTVSACMIVHNAEGTLKKCLDSFVDCVDEILICVDETTTDKTQEIINNYIDSQRGYWPVIKSKTIKSPLEIGFDEARNESIRDASGDWVFWIDDDETVSGINNIFKYLHNNAYDGYAIKQHHFSMEPLGVMKTDLPCRLFRNHKGVKFYGVVHEHPELVMNSGVGHVQLLPDVEIAHNGYEDEDIRRGRFHRNLDLLARDREKYPDRILGKFLWVRDLAQMCKYEMEMNGGRVTQEMKLRADEGIILWEDLLNSGELRMISDGMEFYSFLAQIKGNSFEFGFMIDSSKLNGGLHLAQAKPIQSHFVSIEHVNKLMQALTNEKVKDYDSKYY